jgi:ankyrin repeat protein
MLGAVKRAIANAAELEAERSQQGTKTDDARLPDAHPTAKFDLESATPDGMTPLMCAACDGALGIAQDLLTRGADVNTKRHDGFTALSLAAFFGHFRIVELLLERGADVEATCRFGTSAEMWARARGFVGITESLRKVRLLKNTQASAVVAPLAEEHPSTIPVCEHEYSSEVGDEFAQSDEDDLETTREVKRIVNDVTQKTAEQEPSVGTSDQLVRVQTARQKQRVIDDSYPIPDPFPDTLKPANEQPEFRPELIFLARISSSGKNLAVLTLVVMLVCGVVTFAILKIHADFPGDPQERSELKNIPSATQRPAEPKAPVPSLERTNSDQPSNSPASAHTDSASSALKVERGSSASKKEWQSDQSTRPKASQAVSDTKTLDLHTNRAAGNKVSAYAKNPGSPSTTLPADTPERRPVSINAIPRQAAPEMESKPAPLSVEVSRRRSVSSSASTNADQVSGSQSLGTAIPSGKPKSKVIQWP